MSFHDQLAQAARRNGDTPASMRRAAKQYANATGVLIVLGLITWGIGSWIWASIPWGLALFLAVQGYSDSLVADRLEKLDREP